MEISKKNMLTEYSLCRPDKGIVDIYVREEDYHELEFSAQELKRYIGLAFELDAEICIITAANNKSKGIILVLDDQGRTDPYYDEFSIYSENGNVIIKGVNYRSVLFGVYKFLEEYAGVKWPGPDMEVILQHCSKIIKIRDITCKPDIQKRGFAFNLSGWTPSNTTVGKYLTNMVDWMTKNYCNTVYIQFDTWMQFRDEIVLEIKKRHLLLVLNGHSFVDIFMSSDKYFDEHPDWFALNDGKRVRFQHCFSNNEGMKTAISNIIKFLESENEIRIETISIWPNETSPCQCDLCRKTGFNGSFLNFLKRLRDEIRNKNLNVGNTEVIAYNASLKWEMLEEIPEDNDMDVLVACWGRSYEFPISNPANAVDLRFKKAMKQWADACVNRFRTGMTVLEYYGTYWMLSSLFPSLVHTISEDMGFYGKIGALGVIFLIVPYELQIKCIQEDISGKQPVKYYDKYEFNSEHVALGANLYAFVKKAYDLTKDYNGLVQEYCNTFYGKYGNLARNLLESIEDNISGLSEFNCKLFTLRFIDVWHRDSYFEIGVSSENTLVPLGVKKWSAGDDISIPAERLKTCSRIIKNMNGLYIGIGNTVVDENDIYCRNIKELQAYYKYIFLKIKSIYFQSLSQINIIQKETMDARVNLESALKIEKEINGLHTEDIQYWLEEIRK
ncbi:MAG: DUF4838 domain-containing protein [Ruminiclostridium sp.]|nr:DUF4838 domain-containing protein [Ruminiclostridium sp.]